MRRGDRAARVLLFLVRARELEAPYTLVLFLQNELYGGVTTVLLHEIDTHREMLLRRKRENLSLP